MNNTQVSSNARAQALANRIIQGAQTLADFSQDLTETEWKTPVLGDGRSIGVVIHHVANVYPVEIELAQVLASGKPITGATMKIINEMNAQHAEEYSDINKAETLELLKRNSEIAAQSVAKFSIEELENSATVSLYYDAPLTSQFFIEDHALRHSFHHLAKIKETLNS